MNKGIEIARGKTKVLYEAAGSPDQLVVAQTDDITAGDGARRNQIPGKGRLAAQTTARVFRLLNLCGLPTHYLNGGEDDDNNEMLVRRCNMIPLEVVVRGVAAGSFVKRNPGVQRGALMVPRVIEFFFKDDAAHDPMITPDAIVGQGIANPNEVGVMTELARLTFEILSHAWRKRDVLLVDLKLEFGRLAGGPDKGQLVIADVIDNDAWRIWPQGREEMMLDKQMYRNLETVDDAALAHVKSAYEEVAELVGTFPVMQPSSATRRNARNPSMRLSQRCSNSDCRPFAISRVPRKRRGTCCNSFSNSKQRLRVCSLSRSMRTVVYARCSILHRLRRCSIGTAIHNSLRWTARNCSAWKIRCSTDARC
jgi:phosphoribosylaminoimidazole-succinocarboxamide synthase